MTDSKWKGYTKYSHKYLMVTWAMHIILDLQESTLVSIKTKRHRFLVQDRTGS